MKIFKIYACAYGTFWVKDVNCPPYCRGSGCYDEVYGCYQEATFDVAAKTLENALRLVDEQFGKSQGHDWSYSVESVYYDPKAVEEKDDPDDGDTEEVFDWNYEEPVNGADVPKEYANEICEFEFAWMRFVGKEPNAPTDPKTKKLAKRFFNLGRYGKR